MYRDSSVANGKQYYYVVAAVNTNGESQNTEEIIVSPARVVTVAQDGSGDFTNITDALATIPANNNARTVIYVKQGTYRERSIVTAPYVSIVGAGQDATKIVYDLSNADMPNQAVNGATVAVSGDNFIAANLTIENDSKPSDGQALALSVNADKAVFENVKLVVIRIHCTRVYGRLVQDLEDNIITTVRLGDVQTLFMAQPAQPYSIMSMRLVSMLVTRAVMLRLLQPKMKPILALCS